MIRDDFRKIFGFSNRMTDWKISKIKQVVATKITDGPHETPELVEDGIPFISAEAIKNDRINFALKRGFITEEAHQEYSRKCKPQKNDIFIIKSGATTGNVAYVDVDLEFNIWSPLAVVRCNERIADYKFIYYQFLSDIFKKQVSLSWSFGTQENIGMGVIERLNAVCPGVDEQRIISAYLDKQCAAIDKVLKAKREQLTVLEELRKSIIHKAVTKGLDDSVEMKDSGIEWIGKVPKHWEKEKLFRICQMVSSGGTPSTFEPDYYDGNIIWVQTGDLNDGYIETTEKTITEEGLQDSSAKLFPAGTLIIALYGATIGKLGLLVKESATNQACCAMVFYPWMDAKYFFYLFFDYRDVLISCGYGGGQNNISQGTIKQTYLCFPKYDEQLEIIKYLDKECDRIEKLRKNLNDQISTLEQYRASLIHECVTGKRRITEKDLKELANV